MKTLRPRGLIALFSIALLSVGLLLPAARVQAQADDHHSVAREWNEALLFAIRNDFARPTVHARNLFHASAAMYDAWALFHPTASPYFLGKTQSNGYRCSLSNEVRDTLAGAPVDEAERQRAVEVVLGVALHRLLSHRFERSPGVARTLIRFNQLLQEQGIEYDENLRIDDATPEALGNHLAQCIIEFGLTDGANEEGGYGNRYYQVINAPLSPMFPGNPTILDPDRWQPLLLDTFIDQSGNPGEMPEFLSPEWGNVQTFALPRSDSTISNRDGDSFRVYLDPGPPTLFANDAENYAWGHTLVAVWSSHLDPADGVLWDISPATIGAVDPLPDVTTESLRNFYQYEQGGVVQPGHIVNPVTGEPYAPNTALRGDYTRVIAEYWADGPDSETPPGHWFTILNEFVLDHPDFERLYRGTGEVLDPLEFDIRSYFLLGGAMHDAAITAWSIKGWYDYVRPVSALRYLSQIGQRTDQNLQNFEAQGLPLLEGTIEVVEAGDPLAGNGGVHVGKIKVRAWRGPGFIRDPETDAAGVGWILLENWWPYQRPTFVTPPFAGYVSGHSTFSRAGAEVLTFLTGSEYFPGGLAEFVAPANEFLVFEEGPSQDVVLQWATFRDASDQSSLSRIWGGIHPPIDDIPGRKLGIQVADRVVARAESFFSGNPLPLNGGNQDGMDGDGSTVSSNGGSRGGGCALFRGPVARVGDSSLPLVLLIVCLFGLHRASRKNSHRLS